MKMPYTPAELADRLSRELAEHGRLFVAFDFDNTIFDYHNEGRDYSDVIRLLQRCSDMGHKMILLTANEDADRLRFIRDYCQHFGIRIDYVNENPEVCPGCRKPYYNIFLDDRAGLVEACTTLQAVLDYCYNDSSKQQPK